MPTPNETYTYHGGHKIHLRKRPDEFVIRLNSQAAEKEGFRAATPMSPSSSRVHVVPSDLESNMARARQLAPTHHAYERTESGQEFLITDRILVTFKSALSSEELDKFIGKYGLVRKETYSNRDYLFQLTDHTGMNPVKLVVKLNESEPSVERAEHDLNHRMARSAVSVPTDPFYTDQWHLHLRSTKTAFDPRASARCEQAWQILDSLGSSDVVVGISDDGCRLDHPDFNGSSKFAAWGYFKGERLVKIGDVDADASKMYQVAANHGTACAGVIGAEVDGTFAVGAAAGCRLLPIKWESDGDGLFVSDSKLLTMLDYLSNKIDVLSNSWGSAPSQTFALSVKNKIHALGETGGRRGRGIIFLWAAGNENCPIEHDSNVNIPYTDGWVQTGPDSWGWAGVKTSRNFHNNLVGEPSVMFIAALASTAHRSHYSNYGTGMTLCAPSSNGHAYFRMTVSGIGITTDTGESSFINPEFGGTSSATPLVAAIAALVISANPNLTAKEVISILKRSASKNLDMSAYPRTPPANFDPNPTWDVSPVAPFADGTFKNINDADGTWSPWFGFGRVDAEAAVAAAKGVVNQPQPAAALSFESNPELAIPDNNLVGIRNAIQVAQAGTVGQLKVSVNILHPWIGDLRVRLLAPSGTAIVLHDRTGSDADNINKVYDFSSLPALASLQGQSIKGDWVLEVVDTASADTGILKGWKLGISAGTAPLTAEDAVSVKIPDNNAVGITRTLALAGNQPMSDFSVAVDITHSWIGDLRVTLKSPSGDKVVLHNVAGGDADNIVRTWSTKDFEPLRVLRGKPAAGSWQLLVVDTAAQDEGKLNRWKIEATV